MWYLARRALHTGANDGRIVKVFPRQVGGNLHARIVGQAVVRVIPSVLEDTRIHISEEEMSDIWRIDLQENNTITIENSRPAKEQTVIEAYVPCRSNVNIHATQAAISVTEYLEGDVELIAGKAISLRKLRGNTVKVHSNDGGIHVENKVEALSLTLFAGNGAFTAKKLLASEMELSVRNGDLKLSSGFVDQGSIKLENAAADLNGYHGVLDFSQSGEPRHVEIRGMNGQLNANLQGDSETVVQFDSLFEGSTSSIRCSNGVAQVTIPTDQVLTIRGKSPQQVSLPAEVTCTTDEQGVVVGLFQGNPEPSRVGRTSGKINIAEAFKKEHLWGNAPLSERYFDSISRESSDPIDPLPTVLEIEAEKDRIHVQALGWMARIKSRFLEKEH